jgi:alkylation response protein AidB-like acyl-CoA dehydrogenase
VINQVGVADNEDQRALAEAVARLVSRQWPADALHKQIADPSSITELPLWSALAELGVAGLPVPEEQGGSGGRWTDLAVALEVTGAALSPTPAVAVAAALGALTALDSAPATALRSALAGGTELATATWIARGQAGVRAGAFDAFEAQDGADENQVLITGSVDVLLSPEAGHVLLLADRAGEPVLAEVATGAAGVLLQRVEAVDPTRPVGSLRLDSAAATVLARGDEALAAVRRSLVSGGLASAAELVGVAGHCLTGAVAYAGDRQQFGRPIGSFQAIKHRAAEMLAETEMARAATRHLADLLDADDTDADDLDDALALTLVQAARAANTVSNEYLQICGGIGFTWEHEVHLYLRRAAAAAPLFGGPGAHRRRLDPTVHRPQGAAQLGSLSGPAAELDAHVRELLPRHRAKWSEDNSFRARMDWQQTLHAVGWIAPQWPTEFGGRGLSIVDQVLCDRVLAVHRAPSPLAAVLGVNNVAPTLMRFGTPEQQRHLAAIQSGTELWCQGFSEPGSGSDLASLRTRAVIEGDGEDREFVISGQKVWTSEGMEASHCMLLVRTDPDAPAHRGISALLVPLDSPGVTRRPIVQITGEGGFAEVFYDEVRVPYSALLGPLHEGWNVTMTTLGFERAGVIEMAAELELSVEDLVTELSGRDLDPETRLELTDRLIEARLVGQLGERALGLIADGGAPGAEHSVIKLLWARAYQRLGDTHLAALGLDTVLAGPGRKAHHSYLSTRAATIAGGTTEIMRNILAERVLGMPR